MSTYLGAAGIGVADLEKSADFYCQVFGMVRMQTLTLEHMNEIILGFTGSRSAAVVLMHYTDGSAPNYSSNPVKLVFYVDLLQDNIDRIKSSNHEIVQQPTLYESMGGATIAFAKDPDGYLVEMIQKPAKAG
jgi:lactoylglutathione lyase